MIPHLSNPTPPLRHSSLPQESNTPEDQKRLQVNADKLPDSPCVAVCSTLFDDICRGCGRTVMEVSNWVFMTDEEKKAVWKRILAQGYPRRA